MDQEFEVGIADRPHCCRETVLVMAHGQSAVQSLVRKVTYLTIHEQYFLMYLSGSFSEDHRLCSVRLIQGAPTQELSETDNIRGAKLEVDVLGVLVPLMDGVFSPCATEASAPLFRSAPIVPIVEHMSDVCIVERKQAYREAASIAH